MSAAFIRKTPNYPLSHTVFHLLLGKQRLLIRKAALSTTSLAGDGVEGQMPASPSKLLHPEKHSAGQPGCWKLRLPLPLATGCWHRAQRGGLSGPAVTAAWGRCCPHGQTAIPGASQATTPPTHTAHSPRKRRSGPTNRNAQEGQPAPLSPFFFSLPLLQQRRQLSISHQRFLWPKGATRGHHRHCAPPSKTSPSRSCRRRRPESLIEDL